MSSDTMPDSSAKLKIGLLGRFEVLIDGVPMAPLHSRKEQWLLALLVLRNGKEISRSQLAGVLWADSREENALANMRSSLYLLRRALGDEAPRLQPPSPRSLRFDLNGTFTDVTAFDAALANSDTESLQAGVALYRGPLLEGCDEPFIIGERQAREHAYQQALETLASRALDLGNPSEALTYLRLLIKQDPMCESAHRSMMQALANEGDYAAMVLVYRNLRLLLRQEINVDPASETTSLYEVLRTAAMQEARSRPTPRQPPATGPFSPGSEGEQDNAGDSLDTSSPLRFAVVPRNASRLPRPLTALIGRTREIEAVRRCLEQSPLVTLTGTGGVGKTRIALHIAHECAQKEEVWFVELVSLTSYALLTQAVARSLQVTEEPGTPLDETLRRCLAGQPGLLVLDNCEHLLEEVARLAGDLLQSCPGLRILAASRQALGMTGEAIILVAGLETPPAALPVHDGEGSRLATMPDYEAVRLFVERAHAATPAFRLTPQNSVAVMALCRHLDGIPLAIELTAAWASVLTPEQMLSRRERRFGLLVSRRPDHDHRHRSLEATLDWSCKRLDPELHRFLTCLSVFRGGWSLEAAEAVCLPPVVDAMEQQGHVLEYLALLHERSLLQTTAATPDMRYSLLEIVREYAAELLAEEERAALMQRHTHCFLALAEEAATHLKGPEQAAWLDRLEAESDNLRAALTWCAQDAVRTGVGLRISVALWRFWDVRGYHREGTAWLTLLLARDAAEPIALRAEAREAAGLLINGAREHEVSRAWSLEALELYQEIGNRMGVARTLCSLAMAEVNLLQIESAHLRLEACLPVMEEQRDDYELGRALSALGSTAQRSGDLKQATIFLRRSVECYRSCRHLHGVALSLYRLGGIAMLADRTMEARSLFLEALALSYEVEDRTTLPFGLFHLGQISLIEGDLLGAERFLNEAILCSRVAGNYPVEATSLVLLGDIAVKRRDSLRAFLCYREAATYFARENHANGVCLVAARLASLAQSLGKTALAVRLHGFASLQIVPVRKLRRTFFLYMSLGYLFVPLDQYEADLVELRALMPDDFDSLWMGGRAMSQASALRYLPSLEPFFT